MVGMPPPRREETDRGLGHGASASRRGQSRLGVEEYYSGRPPREQQQGAWDRAVDREKAARRIGSEIEVTSVHGATGSRLRAQVPLA